MRAHWLVLACGLWLSGVNAGAANVPSQWEQPASALAEQIAGLLGPGQAQLSIRNLSTISASELPMIRRLLEQDLKTHGILNGGPESANTIRITLSEDLRERLWVAEVVQGSETRVAMVHVDLQRQIKSPAEDRTVLRKERYLGRFELTALPGYPVDEPILAVLETHRGLIVLKQTRLLILDKTPDGWDAVKGFDLGKLQFASRDPRGTLHLAKDGDGFVALTAGIECAGRFAPTAELNRPPGEGWSLQCHASDDPWPLGQTDGVEGTTVIKAFFNPARNFFTGVINPNTGVELPRFFAASPLARASGDALLLIGIDGKVQLVENGALSAASGTRDWGSDLAILYSHCGSGTQIVASSSGEALQDSLRAYELPDLEALPASALLNMDGTVTSLWTAQDSNGVFAVVRNAQNEYEVDRVTATCN